MYSTKILIVVLIVVFSIIDLNAYAQGDLATLKKPDIIIVDSPELVIKGNICTVRLSVKGKNPNPTFDILHGDLTYNFKRNGDVSTDVSDMEQPVRLLKDNNTVPFSFTIPIGDIQGTHDTTYVYIYFYFKCSTPIQTKGFMGSTLRLQSRKQTFKYTLYHNAFRFVGLSFEYQN